MARQRFKVLHDGGEVELVACAGEAAQTHSLEAVMGLQMCKAHLDLLALVAGLGELRRPHQRAGMIAGILVEIAWDLAGGCLRAALRLERAGLAVPLERNVAQNMVGADAACGREQLAGWADVDVALIVECKVGTRESAILTGALIPDWNVRRDTGLDQPTQELAGAVRPCRRRDAWA